MTNQRFASVWDAIEDTRADAACMKVRSEMMIVIREAIGQWHLPSAEAAVRLGLTKPRMEDLLRGRVDKFDIDSLMTLATIAGLDVKWTIAPKAA